MQNIYCLRIKKTEIYIKNYYQVVNIHRSVPIILSKGYYADSEHKARNLIGN